MMRFALFLGLAALNLCVASAHATGPLIESTGTATIDVEPDEIVFLARQRYADASLESGNDRATAMRRTLESGMNDLELRPLRVSPVQIGLDLDGAPAVSAELELAFAAGANDGPLPREAVARLAERLRKLAVATDIDIRFAGFAIREPETVEQDAVARATENALYHADAVGALVNAHVAGVERVTVDTVNWHGLAVDSTDSSPVPWPPEVRCEAFVTVVYAYESAGRR